MTRVLEAMVMVTGVLGATLACDSCRAAKEHLLEAPEQNEASELVKRSMRDDATVAEKLCGVRARGIEVTSIDMDAPTLGSGTARIGGNGLELADGGAGKALLCTGAVFVVFLVLARDDAGKPTKWGVSRIEVEEVTTPGHEWKKPPSPHDD